MVTNETKDISPMPDTQTKPIHTKRAWWGQPTPGGRIYQVPQSVDEVTAIALQHSQMGVENKTDICERPPNPTWKIVGILLEEIDRLNALPIVEWWDAANCVPISNDPVMAYDPNDPVNMPVAAYYGTDNKWHYEDDGLAGDPNVTHWHYPVMPV